MGGGDGEEGGFDAGCLLLVEVEGEEGKVGGDFGVDDFRPVEDLEVLAGMEEGKELNAHWGEEEVCVADAAVGEVEKSQSRGEGEESPPK